MSDTAPTPMKLEIETSAFNDRRYGKPWIAAVSFANGCKADFTFGDWVGSHGSEGLLILDLVKPGDVIARGQKDNRGAAYKSSPDYYQIDRFGAPLSLKTPAEAYKAWRENAAKQTEAIVPNPLAEFSLEDLQAEISRRQA